MIVGRDDAVELAARALRANRTSRDNAQIVSEVLVAAEAAGQAGHGLRRVPSYAAQARSGKVDGYAVPEVRRTSQGGLLVDARNGFSYPALRLASGSVAEVATELGVGIVGVTRSHHAGAIGLFVSELADLGHVSLMFANTPAAMAPWGGTQPLFGTNPIAFACPVNDGAPMVVDLSLSRVARGKLMAAAQRGREIPLDWALDADGKPTSNPAHGMAGTMTPMGDAKGATLAMMVELLCAGLTGANFAYEASSYFDAAGRPPGTGQFIIALRPDIFGNSDTVARFSEMAGRIADTEGARVPGWSRREARDSALMNGLDLDEAVVEDLKRLARPDG